MVSGIIVVIVMEVTTMKIGDRVKIVDVSSLLNGRIGTIIKIYRDMFLVDTISGEWYWYEYQLELVP